MKKFYTQFYSMFAIWVVLFATAMFLIGFYDLHFSIYIVTCLLLLATVFGMLVFYYKKANYICSHCKKIFKQTPSKWAFAFHTLTTRKLECPKCGKKDYCKETTEKIN